MIRVALALIHREGRWFLQRRAPAALVLPEHWEFPGGKIESGETPEAALMRELQEELGWVSESLKARPTLSYSYPDRTVVLHPFLCHGVAEPATDLGWGWFLPSEIVKLPIPEANRGLVRQLCDLDFFEGDSE